MKKDEKIIALYELRQGRLGLPKLTKELQESGELCSKNRVAKRMKQLNLHAKTKKKFKVTTDSKHHLTIAPNLLNRDFTALAPNQKWCGDIS